MEEQVKVISLLGEHPDGGSLWFGFDDPKTAQRLFDYITCNIELDEPVQLQVCMVSKADFDKEE